MSSKLGTPAAAAAEQGHARAADAQGREHAQFRVREPPHPHFSMCTFVVNQIKRVQILAPAVKRATFRDC
jgi:hypothetical protein